MSSQPGPHCGSVHSDMRLPVPGADTQQSRREVASSCNHTLGTCSNI